MSGPVLVLASIAQEVINYPVARQVPTILRSEDSRLLSEMLDKLGTHHPLRPIPMYFRSLCPPRRSEGQIAQYSRILCRAVLATTELQFSQLSPSAVLYTAYHGQRSHHEQHVNDGRSHRDVSGAATATGFVRLFRRFT